MRERAIILSLTSHLSEVNYEKIPVPEPAADEVLVNIKYSGVCHTYVISKFQAPRLSTNQFHSDLHALQGDWPLATKMPFVGGHEGAGYVVKLGSLVTDVKIGDKVGIKVCLLRVKTKANRN